MIIYDSSYRMERGEGRSNEKGRSSGERVIGF
jgi:hypothetical protein